MFYKFNFIFVLSHNYKVKWFSISLSIRLNILFMLLGCFFILPKCCQMFEYYEKVKGTNKNGETLRVAVSSSG